MKTHALLVALIIAAFVSIVAGCANEPILQEYMIIVPDTMVFHAPLPGAATQDSTISITHSCSCPFSWSATIVPPSDTAWLTFPTYQSGDKSDVPISIDRANLTSDTSRATINIASNSYGDTSILIIAIR